MLAIIFALKPKAKRLYFDLHDQLAEILYRRIQLIINLFATCRSAIHFTNTFYVYIHIHRVKRIWQTFYSNLLTKYHFTILLSILTLINVIVRGSGNSKSQGRERERGVEKKNNTGK